MNNTEKKLFNIADFKRPWPFHFGSGTTFAFRWASTDSWVYFQFITERDHVLVALISLEQRGYNYTISLREAWRPRPSSFWFQIYSNLAFRWTCMNIWVISPVYSWTRPCLGSFHLNNNIYQCWTIDEVSFVIFKILHSKMTACFRKFHLPTKLSWEETW